MSFPSESDIIPPNPHHPGAHQNNEDASLRQLLREVQKMSDTVEEVRNVLMVSTAERGCVLDVLRMHSAQIKDIQDWQERREKEPSGPKGTEKMIEKIGEGIASSIGTGIVALLGWGAYYLLTKGP